MPFFLSIQNLCKYFICLDSIQSVQPFGASVKRRSTVHILVNNNSINNEIRRIKCKLQINSIGKFMKYVSV